MPRFRPHEHLRRPADFQLVYDRRRLPPTERSLSTRVKRAGVFARRPVRRQEVRHGRPPQPHSPAAARSISPCEGRLARGLRPRPHPAAARRLRTRLNSTIADQTVATSEYARFCAIQRNNRRDRSSSSVDRRLGRADVPEDHPSGTSANVHLSTRLQRIHDPRRSEIRPMERRAERRLANLPLPPVQRGRV